jgi:hypothetical protein
LAGAALAFPCAVRADPRPAWLAARPGTLARVEVAPWFVSDEPEAALTESARSVLRDFTADATRPEDVVYEPIGVRVRVVRLAGNGRVALVRGVGARWQAFAPLDRLVPEIPPGTKLRVAGGFGGFAEFYPALATPQDRALQIATATDLLALRTGVAPFDRAVPEFVRVAVRVTSGVLRGRTGWIGTNYVGAAAAEISQDAPVPEQVCTCLLVQFAGP